MTEQPAVAPALGQALAARGYNELTPVQTAMLDPALENEDLLVSAQTGSGKTVAFGIAMAESLLQGENRLDKAEAPLALVVAPTRELAMQVHRELEWLYAAAGAHVVSCVGGMDARDERRALARGAHIVVGTPGRLVDHINRSSLILDDIRVIVMDEADEMLDLGFRDELETILKAAPDERRTLLFSATVSKPIAKLAASFQKNAVRVNTISETDQHVDIDYRAHAVAPADTENAIINVLRFHESKNALVFCKTRANVNHLLARFHNRGLSVVALSGELSQTERTHALQALRDGRANVCVATDVAARGLDLPDLDLVIHADLPANRESLLHRSGRTGRAGRKGVSVLITPFKARRRVERLLGDAKVEATWEDAPGVEDIQRRDDERLLNHPSLSEPVSAKDAEMAKSLIDIHGAEQIAAAFVALHRAKRSAPEDLMPVPEDTGGRSGGSRDGRGPKREPRAPREPRARRDDFDDGVWITVSVGRKAGAEPRWLLPMLCKSGGLDRSQVGAIQIEETVSKVELKADSVEPFFATIGPDGRLEKSITAWREGDTPPPRGPSPASNDWSGPKPGKSAKKPHRKGGKPAPRRAEWSPEEAPARKPRPTAPADLDRAPSDKPKRAKPKKHEHRFDASANKPPKRKKPKRPKE
ncbi:DEAD/DEAH box helicase [Henriciella litoralis]|uniref:DEAD/DEAH box helicase n=1 Tax=Henriciella litoralis TaxID=568102 RepID=UPI0009FDEA28|nr:DEAD/DEAH box helicase [Henriciella litoralis]